MTSLDRSVPHFIDAIASENVTPAGITAAAVSGAIGAALLEMACIHSDTREHARPLAPVETEFREHRERLLALATADERVVDDLFATSSSDPTDDEFKRVTSIPLSVASVCLSVLEAAELVADECSSAVLADAVGGAMLAKSALDASLYTVRYNGAFVSDRSFRNRTERRADAIEHEASARYETMRRTDPVDAFE